MSEATASAGLKLEFNQEYRMRFREGRKAGGGRLKNLAEFIHTSPQAVLQFEKGIQSLSLEKFALGCEFLQLDIRWVLFGRGEMFDGPAPAPRGGRKARRVATTS